MCHGSRYTLIIECGRMNSVAQSFTAVVMSLNMRRDPWILVYDTWTYTYKRTLPATPRAKPHHLATLRRGDQCDLQQYNCALQQRSEY